VDPVTQVSELIQPQNLSIRQMKLEDVPRVHEIDVLSFSLPWPQKSYLFELNENPTTLALVAETVTEAARSLVIGMSVVWIVVDEAHIATIAIHPDFRGQGYGKRLLGESLRKSILRGVTQATLEVRMHNRLAQQMYVNFGFKIVGRRLHYYQDNSEDAIIMTVKKLGENYLQRLSQMGV
jgi:ribosomal-protein-alanine N-acetyltransferase